MNTKAVLDLKFYSQDLCKEVTVRSFFYEIMEAFLIEREEFNSERPFGNSHWDADLLACLIKHELVDGDVDEDGFVEDCDYEEAEKFLHSLAEAIFLQT